MKKGFTLIELLAVIIILAVLMIVAVPNVLNVMSDAKVDIFVTQAQSLYTTAETEWVKDMMNGETTELYDNETNPLELSTIGANVKYRIVMNPSGKVQSIIVDDGNYHISLTGDAADIKKDIVGDGTGSVEE